MAAHGDVEFATAPGNDYPEHEGTYKSFVALATIGSLHVICVVIGLAIGGVQDHWLTAAAVFVVATIAAGIGGAMGTTVPLIGVLILSLLALIVG